MGAQSTPVMQAAGTAAGIEAAPAAERLAAADTERFAALFRHLLADGIYLPPSQFECLFPSTAHTDEQVDATIAAARSFFESQR